ncbi:MAG: hypothetical protein U1E29_00060 [Coriobacteriia bacterium]|nr:hypothetical protein [Coriobacteriia bacterium]
MAGETYRRGISAEFEDQLRSGILAPLLERVRHDDTLTLEIRNGYVNIYYRGGRLLGIHEQANGVRFSTEFDERYCGTAEDYRAFLPRRPERIISTAQDSRKWVDAFSHYKQAMDIRFSKHPKLEREYQQAVLRDNNRHASGELSDYIIVDVEYAQSAKAGSGRKAEYRFDMVGFRWPARGKSRASGEVNPVIMEMKVGDGVLASGLVEKGSEKLLPGLLKHFRDIEGFLTPDPDDEFSEPYKQMCAELKDMLEIKQRLGLPSIPKNMRGLKIKVNMHRPEVLIVVANHHPRSRILARELKALPASEYADYRLATVQYGGYALFADNMISIRDYVSSLPG